MNQPLRDPEATVAIDDVKSLTSKLAFARQRLARIQKDCRHDFTQPFEKTQTSEKEVIDHTSPLIHHGSDTEYPTSWQTVRTKTWVRYCSICGLEQVTDKQKKLPSQFEPDFT